MNIPLERNGGSTEWTIEEEGSGEIYSFSENTPNFASLVISAPDDGTSDPRSRKQFPELTIEKVEITSN